MGNVTKGAVSSSSKAKKAAPKLAKLIADETENASKAVSFVSRKGVDGAFVIPPGPKYNTQTGVQIGYDTGVHLDFQGVGVTKPYYPETNSVHRDLVQRVKDLIADHHPIVEDIGLEILQPKAPRPPFAKWDRADVNAIKITLATQFDEDDHDENVRVVKEAARYELANQNRPEVIAMLDGLMAVEAAESDEFDVEVSVK